MTKEKEKDKKEFQRNKETINIKEFMLLKSGKQDELIEETLNKIYEENVEINKKYIDKVLNVAFDNKDNETFLPHSLCVQKDGNKLIFSFKKNNKALLILFLLGFLFIAGFSTFTGVQLIGKAWMNVDINDDGIPDINLDLNDDGICEVNCTKNKLSKKPVANIDYRGNRKPTFNVVGENGNITNKINQLDENGKCLLNCDTDDDGWPDINIDTDGDGKADLNIDSDGDGNPDLNIDTNGDGVPDINIDEDGDGKCDKNCTYVANIKGGQANIGQGDVTADTAALVVMFEAGDNVILKDMYPDDQPGMEVKRPQVKFSIENKTNVTLYYNIYWTEIENTFESDNFWYRVESTGNGYKTDWKITPKQNGLEVARVAIAPMTKQEYITEFTLHGTDSEQNVDQGKTFKGRFLIELLNDNE